MSISTSVNLPWISNIITNLSQSFGWGFSTIFPTQMPNPYFLIHIYSMTWGWHLSSCNVTYLFRLAILFCFVCFCFLQSICFGSGFAFYNTCLPCQKLGTYSYGDYNHRIYMTLPKTVYLYVWFHEMYFENPFLCRFHLHYGS